MEKHRKKQFAPRSSESERRSGTSKVQLSKTFRKKVIDLIQKNSLGNQDSQLLRARLRRLCRCQFLSITQQARIEICFCFAVMNVAIAFVKTSRPLSFTSNTQSFEVIKPILTSSSSHQVRSCTPSPFSQAEGANKCGRHHRMFHRHHHLSRQQQKPARQFGHRKSLHW